MSQATPTATLHFHSFGFKHNSVYEKFQLTGGFVVDCRVLPNPYWVEELSAFSGKDQPIRDFFSEHDSVGNFIEATKNLLIATLAAHQKKQLSDPFCMPVYFGCTGGKHRSVYIAESLSQILIKSGYDCKLTHLDIEKE